MSENLKGRPPAQPKRAEVPENEWPSYDALTSRFRAWFQAGDGPVDENFNCGSYFGALMNSPKMAQMSSEMGTFFRGVGNEPGSYSHADREFIDQVLAAEYKSNVVQNVHLIDAVKAGVRIEAIEALRDGRDGDLTEDELLLATYIRQVVRGTVEDATYARMERRLGTRGVVEYTGFIMWLTWIMRMMQALDTGTISDEEVDRLVAQGREISAEKDWHGGAGSWRPKRTGQGL